MTTDHQLDPRFVAGVDLLRRAGAAVTRIGHFEPEDGDNLPVIWHCTVELRKLYGIAHVKRYECAASIDPVNAVLRLCERLIDGAVCTHCGQMTTFVTDTDTRVLDQFTCVYAWDPELSTFRRGCEGDAP